MKDKIVLRDILMSDCAEISKQFASQGWDKPESQYLSYIELQKAGARDVIVAEMDGKIAGYLTINWESEYELFRERGIPEVVDFNVLKKFQRRGIGTALMDEAERRIKERSSYAGIGFGVFGDYGAAQILYVKRGYVPDGRGVVMDSRVLQYGDEVVIDDSVVLYLVKELV